MTHTPKALVRRIEHHTGLRYATLIFKCPGCEEVGLPEINYLPISNNVRELFDIKFWQIPRTTFITARDINLLTIRPSLVEFDETHVCHSVVEWGRFKYLSDCTHSLAKAAVPIPPLPDWVDVLDQDIVIM